jgi:pyruvate dehydrogenase E2 component (dihydrolipoamide acetyltransferase)
MPGLAANTTEAVLSEWLVAEGTDFAATDPIATVETDKAAVEIEADAAGRMLKALVPAGARVEVGDPIAVLGDPGERVDDPDALLTSLGVSAATDVVLAERRDVPPAPRPVAPPTGDSEARATAAPPSGRTATGRIFTSPLARKIAGQHGLALEDIVGTGPRGRILRRDVDAAIAQGSVGLTRDQHAPQGVVSPAPATSPPTAGALYDEIPHSRIRRATARRLTASKQQAPHFYVRATVRAEALLALRAEINEDTPTRLSINDLVVKAVGAAHRRVPEMNVTWTEDAARRYHSVDVAIAVATDRGLVTPVVRDVGSRTITDLASTIRDLADRAHAGRLRQDDLEGGTIAVTNLGMHGTEEFAAIINPPQSAILAVGAVREEPVVVDGVLAVGSVMRLTLSVDHRSVDGVLAARWMQALVSLLENPVRILA